MRGPDDRPLIDPLISEAIGKAISDPVLLEPIAETIIDLSIAGWDAITTFFRSRPPTAEAPPTAAAIPAPEEAAPAREGRHGTLSLVERDPWEAATDDRTQGYGPEPLEMVPGVDPNGGGQIFAPIRKRPE